MTRQFGEGGYEHKNIIIRKILGPVNVRCFSFGPKTVGLMRPKWAQTKGKWHSTVGMVSPSSAGLLLQWEVERQSHPLPVQVCTQWSWRASLETVQPSPGISLQAQRWRGQALLPSDSHHTQLSYSLSWWTQWSLRLGEHISTVQLCIWSRVS